MQRRALRVEEIINLLREAEVFLSQGESLEAICRQLSIKYAPREGFTSVGERSDRYDLPLPQIHSAHAWEEGGSHFIVDCTSQLRYFFSTDNPLPLPAHQYHLVVLPHFGNMSDIHHDLIHAHTPQDWCALLVDEHTAFVGKNAMISISVAHRYKRYQR